MSPHEQDNDFRPRKNPETAFRDVEEEGGLVVLPGKAEVKVLNPVGSRIYSMLDGEHTIAGIARTLVDEYDVTLDQALQDVKAFVGELSEHGMLSD